MVFDIIQSNIRMQIDQKISFLPLRDQTYRLHSDSVPVLKIYVRDVNYRFSALAMNVGTWS